MHIMTINHSVVFGSRFSFFLLRRLNHVDGGWCGARLRVFTNGMK